MCLAIPGKVISIGDPNDELLMAVVDFDGIKKEVCVHTIDDLKIGDYVLVHAGFAINKVDGNEARKTLAFLRDLKTEDEDGVS